MLGLPRGAGATGVANKHHSGRAGSSLSPSCLQIPKVKQLESKGSLKCLALQGRGAWRGWWILTLVRSRSDPQAPVWRLWLGRHKRGKHPGIFFIPCLSFPACVKRDAILVAQHCDQAGEDTEGGHHVIFSWRTQTAWGFILQQHTGQGCHTT